MSGSDGKPIKERKTEEFLAHIVKAFPHDPLVNPEEVARAVFEVIAKHVTLGEIEHVKITLPSEIRFLWWDETHSMLF